MVPPSTDTVSAMRTEIDSSSAAQVQERLALLRDSAFRYADRGAHVKRARALRATQPGHDISVWRELADLGWLGVLIPEEFGGLGLGCAEMAVIGEVLGSALLPEPVTAAVVFAGGCIVHGENEGLKSELLPLIASGTMVPAVAWREDGHDCDYLNVSTRAERTKNGVRLFGKKKLVIAGATADGLVLSARGTEGMSLYWASRSQLGAVVYQMLPDGRAMAEVTLDGIELPTGQCIAGARVAEAALARAFDEALIITSAELLGISSALLDTTLEYLRTRVQFGKPIGSFQALQHRAVDLYIQLRTCRHTLEDVCDRLGKPEVTASERGAQASRLKARCAIASLHIAKEAVQMHGAMGYSDECDVGLYLKRAVTLSAWLGGADVHRRRYAKLALTREALAANSRGDR